MQLCRASLISRRILLSLVKHLSICFSDSFKKRRSKYYSFHEKDIYVAMRSIFRSREEEEEKRSRFCIFNIDDVGMDFCERIIDFGIVLCTALRFFKQIFKSRVA
jgi:hypothetical protein